MRHIVLISLLLLSFEIKAQDYSPSDSIYIYKTLLKYSSETNSYKDIDEPFIESYWKSDKKRAMKYFEKAAYIESIPIVQRVIMAHYLDQDCKKKLHEWMYSNLESKMDTVKYFKVLRTGYGLPYSELGIDEETVKKYCLKCKYK